MAAKHFTRFAVLTFFFSLACSAQTELKTKQVGKLANVFVISVETKGKALHFIVDTGAASTLLSRDTYTGNVIREDTVTSVNGSASIQEVFAVFNIGDKRIQQRAFIGDLSNVSKAAGITIDGILGQDVLSQFRRVIFDYSKKTITFEP